MKDRLGHGSDARGTSSDKFNRGTDRGRRGKPLQNFTRDSARAERVALRQRTDFNAYGGRRYGSLDMNRVAAAAVYAQGREVMANIPAHQVSTHLATKN